MIIWFYINWKYLYVSFNKLSIYCNQISGHNLIVFYYSRGRARKNTQSLCKNFLDLWNEKFNEIYCDIQWLAYILLGVNCF